MKPITSAMHGILDYAAAAFLVLAPSLFNLDGTAALTFYLLAAIEFVLALLTAFPSGVLKVIPVRVHGGIDLVTAFVIAALPWLLGISQQSTARNLLLAVALLVLVIWFMTQWHDDARRVSIRPS
ncbi:SPW repeat-containing protein [Deinococcus saxicola]|uniref:SPW repeat domain-containing protein n=1 Tax=Deinococcus saxicola TaxID=249406 RepID=UPI0039F04423